MSKLPMFLVAVVAECSSLWAGSCPVAIPQVSSWYAGVIGKSSHTINVKVKNVSGKDIRGMKFVLAYFDATEDLHLTPASLDAADRLKPGQEKKWLNPWDNDSARGRGWLVIPAKVLFEDGSTFTDAVHVPDCYGVLWYDKKHPRLTELPMEVMKRLSATTTP